MHWPAPEKTAYIIPISRKVGPRKGNWKSVKSHGLLLLMDMQFQPFSRIIPWRMRFCPIENKTNDENLFHICIMRSPICADLDRMSTF